MADAIASLKREVNVARGATNNDNTHTRLVDSKFKKAGNWKDGGIV